MRNKVILVMSGLCTMLAGVAGCDGEGGTGGTQDNQLRSAQGAAYDRGGNDATNDQGIKGSASHVGESNRITTGPVTSANTQPDNSGAPATEPAGNTGGNASGLVPGASTNTAR